MSDKKPWERGLYENVNSNCGCDYRIELLSHREPLNADDVNAMVTRIHELEAENERLKAENEDANTIINGAYGALTTTDLGFTEACLTARDWLRDYNARRANHANQ